MRRSRSSTEASVGGGRGRAVCGLLAALAILAAGLSPAAAHDVYIGYGRAEISGAEFTGQLAYNRADLRQVVTGLRAEALPPLAPPEFGALADRYLGAHFQAVAGDDTLKLEVVGLSEEGDNTIVDFRFRGAKPLAALRVRNDVLFEAFPQQVNTLVVRVAAGASRYVFHAGRPVVSIVLAAPGGQ